MAEINIKTQVQGPDEIKINLVREDFLETSHTYRTFFEICLAIDGTLFGNVISLANEENKTVPLIYWLGLGIFSLGCIAFYCLAHNSYRKAKSQTK